jgi:hypothetical protein
MARILIAALATFVALPAPQEKPKPQKEHEWLRQLAGEWTTDGETVAEQGKEPEKSKGSAAGRMLGDFWLLLDVKGDVAGNAFSGLLTIGWDADKKKYVGTWVDSMNPRLWNYTGAVDGAKLTLDAEGPSLADPAKTAKYRDTYEIKEKDHVVLTSFMEHEGKWVAYLTVQFRRAKK